MRLKQHFFDDRMFLARLDDAWESVDKDITRRTFQKLDIKNNSTTSGEERKNNEGPICSQDRSSLIDSNGDNETTLLEKCCEYLFDLFDANLTRGYRRIDLIQEKAIKCFSRSLIDERSNSVRGNKVVEYTFEQEHLHREFKDLFEQLISDFLYDERISVDDFHSILKKTLAVSSNVRAINKKNQKTKFTDEILDCVMWYTDFECWAEFMTAEAKCRRSLGRLEPDDIADADDAFHNVSNSIVSTHTAISKNTSRTLNELHNSNEGDNADEKSDIERIPRLGADHRFSEVLL